MLLCERIRTGSSDSDRWVYEQNIPLSSGLRHRPSAKQPIHSAQQLLGRAMRLRTLLAIININPHFSPSLHQLGFAIARQLLLGSRGFLRGAAEDSTEKVAFRTGCADGHGGARLGFVCGRAAGCLARRLFRGEYGGSADGPVEVVSLLGLGSLPERSQRRP